MRSRTILSTTAGVLGIALLAAGRAGAAERSLLGITLGRSFRTVIQKYGNPTFMTPVVIPTGTAPQMAAQYGGAGGFGAQPGMPGGEMGGAGGPYGGSGGMGAGGPYGGSGGMGAPGMMGGGPPMMGGSGGMGGEMMGRKSGAMSGMGGSGGMGISGAPPVLPSAGGFPGAMGGGPGEPGGMPPGGPGMAGGPGGFGGGEMGGQQGGGVGNAVLWTYRRPGGLVMEFLINEDGLVAQISVAGRKGAARTSKGIGLGSDFRTLLLRYGSPEEYVITSAAAAGVQNASYSAMVKSNGQVTQVFYPKRQHAAFTLLDNRVVRITIALAG